MAYNLMNVGRPEGANPGNAGGLKNRLILMQAEDVLEIPAREEDLVSIKTAIKMKAGKYMREMYLTTKTATPKQEKIEGENSDCGGFKCSIEFFHPGMEKGFQEFLAKFGTGFNGYVIFEDAVNKKYYMLGEPGNEAVLKTSASEWGGKMDGGKKGSTNSFESVQSLPIAIYEGTLVLETTTVPTEPEVDPEPTV